MIYETEDLKKFEKATHCHIYEGNLNKTIKIDHLAKIHKWLRIMRLPNKYPSESDVKKQFWRKSLNIEEHVFTQAKEKLSKYLKDNNKNVIVRDHCHWTGKFRGAAHQECNLLYRKTYKIPCFFHNFTGYDSHHIFQNISSLEKTPTVVAKNMEKFISMDIEHIRIQDPLQFLNYSLDKLVFNLKDKGLKENRSLKDTFPTVYSYFKKKWSHLDGDILEFYCRKGVYPYEYFDTFERFN